MAKSADAWFEEYGQSHQNRINKAIHFVAVPGIYWTVMGLLWSIPSPEWLGTGWLGLAMLPVMYFYFRLGLALGLGMLLITALMWIGIERLAIAGISVWQVSLVLFVVLWVFQFIGHAVEGKRPSFFKDIQFLLVGPAWVLNFVYRKLGLSS